MSNANEPAYPAIATQPSYDRDHNLYAETYSVGGLTKREHAAIALRVPMSGDEDIDAMIRAANRKELAATAMQGLLASPIENFTRITVPGLEEQYQACAEIAAGYADALLAELERTK